MRAALLAAAVLAAPAARAQESPRCAHPTLPAEVGTPNFRGHSGCSADDNRQMARLLAEASRRFRAAQLQSHKAAAEVLTLASGVGCQELWQAYERRRKLEASVFSTALQGEVLRFNASCSGARVPPATGAPTASPPQSRLPARRAPPPQEPEPDPEPEVEPDSGGD